MLYVDCKVGIIIYNLFDSDVLCWTFERSTTAVIANTESLRIIYATLTLHIDYYLYTLQVRVINEKKQNIILKHYYGY